MIPEEAVEAASAVWFERATDPARMHRGDMQAAIEAAAGHIRAQVLEEMAEQVLTNDPLDFWAMHAREGAGYQEAMSFWLKAHARAKMSQTPDDFVTPRG